MGKRFRVNFGGSGASHRMTRGEAFAYLRAVSDPYSFVERYAHGEWRKVQS